MKKIHSLIKKCCSVFYRFLLRVVSLIKLPLQKQYYSAQSYFPEFSYKKKAKIKIFFEQAINVLRFGMPNSYYFLYGLDIKHFKNHHDFVDYTLFVHRRSAMNKRITSYPPIAILRDKSLFGTFAEAYNIYTPNNIGIIYNRKIFLYAEKKLLPFSEYVKLSDKTSDVFIKKIDGECADGIYHIQINHGEAIYKGNRIIFENNTRYLVQSTILNQHHCLSKIFSKSINTLRLVTIHNLATDEIEVFSCVLRVGTGDNNVDNWASGGLSIGVDTEKGILRKYGYYKPGHGTKVIEHPDSHIVFNGYKIPYLQEAIDQAKLFHRYLYGIHSIGWDIAITEEGPCFVEGNDNWEISLMQASNGGLKKEFNELFYK